VLCGLAGSIATPDTVYSFALTAGGTNWGLAQGLGGARSDAFQAGVYGKNYWGPDFRGVKSRFAQVLKNSEGYWRVFRVKM
jgi:hypothetical protein